MSVLATPLSNTLASPESMMQRRHSVITKIQQPLFSMEDDDSNVFAAAGLVAVNDDD